MRKRKYNKNRLKKPIQVNRLSERSTGWSYDIKSKLNKLSDEISGIKERIESIRFNTNNNFDDGRYVPACYKTDLIFNPKSDIITFDNPTNPGNPGFFNEIISNKLSYRTTIPMYGDGVFVANFISLSISHILYSPNSNRYIKYKLTSGSSSDPSVSSIPSILEKVNASVIGTTSTLRSGLNFMWNMMNTSSGRMLSDNLIQDTALLNGPDSSFFTFDVPWVFERDSEIEFHFKPLNSVYQYDVSDPTLPYGINDIVDGKRDNSVTIKLEVHGAKFLTMQDAMRYGAKIWR